MVTSTKQSNERLKIKRYKIQHSIEQYTFPKEAYIHNVVFDEKYMHVELTDERIIRMIIWDLEKCEINDEINILDYLGPTRTRDEASSVTYAFPETRKQLAEAKSKKKK